MNSQTFTLLVLFAVVALIVWRIKTGRRQKQEIDRAERIFQAQLWAGKDLSAVSDEDLLREMGRGGVRHPDH